MSYFSSGDRYRHSEKGMEAKRRARLRQEERLRKAGERRWAAELRRRAAAEKKRQQTLKRLAAQAKKDRKAFSRNPAPKLKKLTKGTGWMNASAVKIRRNKGKVEVLIRRAPKKAARKRVPAKRKTARKRR